MRLASAGWELAFAIVGFAGFGYLVGGLFDASQWGLLIGALLGVVGGLYNLVRTALRIANASGQGREGE